MSWRLAESLKQLRKQINDRYPDRDKTSDGAIGDAAHATKKSDHNPWVKDAKGQGVVTAIDIDEDLSSDDGSTLEDVVSAIRASRDKRVKYIIYEGRITVQDSDLQRWKKYTGVNAHKHHAHISVHSDPKLYDSIAEWKIGNKKASAEPKKDPANVRPDESAVKGEQLNSKLTQTSEQSSTAQPATTEKNATETTVTKETGDVKIEASQKNEQDVNETVQLKGPEPYLGIGFKEAIKRDFYAIGGGNISFQGLSEYAQQASGWPPWIVGLISKVAILAIFASAGWLIFRIVHYLVDTWKKNHKTSTTALINSDVTRKNIEFE